MMDAQRKAEALKKKVCKKRQQWQKALKEKIRLKRRKLVAQSLCFCIHYNVFSIFDGQTQFLSVKGREQMLKRKGQGRGQVQGPNQRPAPRQKTKRQRTHQQQCVRQGQHQGELRDI